MSSADHTPELERRPELGQADVQLPKPGRSRRKLEVANATASQTPLPGAAEGARSASLRINGSGPENRRGDLVAQLGIEAA